MTYFFCATYLKIFRPKDLCILIAFKIECYPKITNFGLNDRTAFILYSEGKNCKEKNK